MDGILQVSWLLVCGILISLETIWWQLSWTLLSSFLLIKYTLNKLTYCQLSFSFSLMRFFRSHFKIIWNRMRCWLLDLVVRVTLLEIFPGLDLRLWRYQVFLFWRSSRRKRRSQGLRCLEEIEESFSSFVFLSSCVSRYLDGVYLDGVYLGRFWKP